MSVFLGWEVYNYKPGHFPTKYQIIIQEYFDVFRSTKRVNPGLVVILQENMYRFKSL